MKKDYLVLLLIIPTTIYFICFFFHLEEPWWNGLFWPVFSIGMLVWLVRNYKTAGKGDKIQAGCLGSMFFIWAAIALIYWLIKS